METRLLKYVILGSFVWAILGTAIAAYYYVQYNTYQKEFKALADEFDSISLKANVLLSYGNGTKTWFNNTAFPLGSTAFNATVSIADKIGYTDYGGELGILVISINGLSGNSTHGWLYWHWDSQKQQWLLPEYSCTRYILHEGDTIAFAYSSYVVWPPLPPTQL